MYLDLVTKMHLVFLCAALADLRGQIAGFFQAHQTLQHFMQQS